MFNENLKNADSLTKKTVIIAQWWWLIDGALCVFSKHHSQIIYLKCVVFYKPYHFFILYI